jgi:hypothetical protein
MKQLGFIPMALAVGALSLAVPAQADDRPFHASAMGGMTISKYGNFETPVNSFQNMKGVTAGLGGSWRLSNVLAVQPEIDYIEKGISFGKSEGTDAIGNPTGTFETLLVQQFLEIPVLLRWGMPTNGSLHPVIEVGPFYSFELSERLKSTGSTTGSTDSSILKDSYYGLVIGAALNVDVGAAQWVIDGRYEPGFAGLGKVFGNADEANSNAFVISTGVRY